MGFKPPRHLPPSVICFVFSLWNSIFGIHLHVSVRNRWDGPQRCRWTMGRKFYLFNSKTTYKLPLHVLRLSLCIFGVWILWEFDSRPCIDSVVMYSSLLETPSLYCQCLLVTIVPCTRQGLRFSETWNSLSSLFSQDVQFGSRSVHHPAPGPQVSRDSLDNP